MALTTRQREVLSSCGCPDRSAPLGSEFVVLVRKYIYIKCEIELTVAGPAGAICEGIPISRKLKLTT